MLWLTVEELNASQLISVKFGCKCDGKIRFIRYVIHHHGKKKVHPPSALTVILFLS